MFGLWLQDGRASVRQLDVPAVGPDEVLLKVLYSGICSTDLELVKGYYPYTGVLGHELVGQITAFGPSSSASEVLGLCINDRVVVEINNACEKCRLCRKGRPTHCLQRKVLGIKDWHGAHANFVVAPVANVLRVPASVPSRWAVFTEPLAAALELQHQVHISPSSNVLVVGAGRLGQLIAWSLAGTTAQLAVVARRERQQQLLQQRGIRWLTEAEITNGRHDDTFDVVVDATGARDGFELCVRLCVAGGTLVLKSTYHGNLSVNMSVVVVKEITIVGSRCGPFAPALRLMAGEGGKTPLDPTPLVDAEFSIHDSEHALAKACEPGVMKILISHCDSHSSSPSAKL